MKIEHLFPAIFLLLAATLQGTRGGMLPGLMPCLTLSTLFYWTLYRPDRIPLPWVFGSGLFLDALEGTPLGCSSLLFLALYAFLRLQRRFWMRLSFREIWMRWGALLTCIEMSSFLVCSLIYRTWLPLLPFFTQTLTTIAIYPLLSALFAQFHRSNPEPPRGT